MFLLSSCSKESKIYVPISLTDKDGNIFIQIDTVSNSFNAYASTKITQGRLKGIFNDTIQSAFYLAIITNPVWDTVYHPADTNIFPTHYTGHTLIVQANVNLTNYTLPYHFLLLGTPRPALKCGSHGNPSIMLTIDTQND
ncbi:MAG: hypothetical protein ABSE72_01115 [Bacteroidales bacterium]